MRTTTTTKQVTSKHLIAAQVLIVLVIQKESKDAKRHVCPMPRIVRSRHVSIILVKKASLMISHKLPGARSTIVADKDRNPANKTQHANKVSADVIAVTPVPSAIIHCQTVPCSNRKTEHHHK